MRFFLFLVTLCLFTGRAWAETLVLENFKGPYDWSEGNKKDGKTDYSVVEENSQKFLRATYIPGTDGKPIYKKIKWNTAKFPILKWRWRANQFPTGAKITDDDKGDAAAQIYVSWKLGGRVYALKYFWTINDPVGTGFHAGKWNPMGRYFAQSIRNGGKTGEWQTETRNLKEDFKKAYSKDMPDEAVGLGVLTDADQTKSQAAADYADFEALTSP